VSDVISLIDANGEGIVIVVDDEERLTATITDGDVRRALLNGVELQDPLSRLIEIGKLPPHDEGPITVTASTPPDERLRLMTEHVLRHLPVVDGDHRVIELALLRELVEEFEEPLEAVVMAGGFGKRIMPLTATTPKPMLRVGDRPVMERTIERLKQSGIKKVNVTLHHLPDQIRQYFGDGSKLGVDIRYVTEDTPLGTAGALRNMASSTEPLLVVNGDIVTSVDFRALLDYHRESGSDLTMGVRKYEAPVPYGVVECSGDKVTKLVEKPTSSLLVNAGIYLLEPFVTEHIPAETHFDMPELVSKVLESGGRVSAFLIHEYWLDIGHPDDYSKAQSDIGMGLEDR